MKFTYTEENVFETEVPFGHLKISGDDTKGFRPFQLMVSSIAVCSGSVLRKVMEKKRMTVHNMEIEADVERDPDRANRLTHIKLHYVIEGEGLKEDKVEKAVHLASKHCPMAQTVADSVEITETFELK